ncbi:MAG: gluconolaconase [Alphaproteobacteria bacterium HGW-Alphaproteobacteria-18]|nr:MAG: gluconolaconase [Alphaproteobacteria bacterium HGW-Alphaproteobacteria-18]
MPQPWELILEVPTADLLGEGVVWDEASGAFLWTDILGRRLHQYDLAQKRLTTVPLPGRLCSFGLTSQAGMLIAAFDREIGWLEAGTGTFTPLLLPDLPPGVRLNDGRVGSDGAFWVGSMVEDAVLAGGDDLGRLYRFSPCGQLTVHIDGICISNGLCWSPQGRRLYHADSLRGRVSAYPFDLSTGDLGEGALLIASISGGSPDGATTDQDGRYYSALWEGWAVGIFSSEGESEGRIDVPASRVTCVAFGGRDLDLLAVTTARVDLSEDQRASEPRAGSLFIYKSPRKGVPERRFAGRAPTSSELGG